MAIGKIIKFCLPTIIVPSFMLSFFSCSQKQEEVKDNIYIDEEQKTQHTSTLDVSFTFTCSSLKLANSLQCTKIDTSKNIGNLSIHAIHVSGACLIVELEFETLETYSFTNTFSFLFSTIDNSFSVTISDLKVAFDDNIHQPAVVFPDKAKLTSTSHLTMNGELDVIFQDFTFEHFNIDWAQEVRVSGNFDFFDNDPISYSIENIRSDGKFDIKIVTTNVFYQNVPIDGNLNFEWKNKSIKKENESTCTIITGSPLSTGKSIPSEMIQLDPEIEVKTFGASKRWEEESEINNFDTLAISDDSTHDVVKINPNGFNNAFTSSIKLIDFSGTKKLKTIDTSAFEGCESVCFSVDFNNNENVIWTKAFMGCVNLPYISFHNYETDKLWLQARAFESSGLKRIKFPKQTHVLSYNAFANCSRLKVLDFSIFDEVPAWLNNAELHTFSGCSPNGKVYIKNKDKIAVWKQCLEAQGLINWDYIPISNK